MEDNLFLKEMGARIREIRLKRGMTLTELSQITKIDRCNLTHVELRGKNCYLLTIKAIAKALDIDIRELFDVS